MMKPWEEEWQSLEGGRYLEVVDGPSLAEINIGPMEPERFRLAAAAPDMARVLLAVEASGVRHQRQCPSCFRHNPGNPPPSDVEHAPNCALDAALRKAGVR